MRSNIATVLALSLKFGWKVFPAKPGDKSPYISGWQQRATSDADRIKQLFYPFPDAMIGLPTGPINGLTIIDLDRKNDVDGVESFRRLALPCSTRASCGNTNRWFPPLLSNLGHGPAIPGWTFAGYGYQVEWCICHCAWEHQ